ncbi:MAG: GntP family permease [Planctomycetaceae bacterium]|nr:GntP family permease [Planctomycetaceae bacterium]
MVFMLDTLSNLVADPLFILFCGILTVIGCIVVLRVNAFLSLLAAAFLVSFMVPIDTGNWADKVLRVSAGFGTTAAKIAILIAMGSIIGKCMMDSGCAERIIRSLRSFFGERLMPATLFSGGFILSIPLFYEAAFYLMLPIARSVYRAMKKNYILYLMAIGLGATLTHTLTPPTPGPIFTAIELKVPIGTMLLVGLMVGALTAPFALLIAMTMNRLMPNPEIHLVEEMEPAETDESKLPPLSVAMAPILVPIVLILSATVMDMLEKSETIALKANAPALWNAVHVLGHPQIAMILAALVSMGILMRVHKLSLIGLERRTETALLSAGLIILIVAAGGAFGEMLRTAKVGEAIKNLFHADGDLTGMMLLLVAFGVTAMIKTAQGSSTVAMITSAGIFSGVIFADGAAELPYNVAYLAVTIGLGSCVTGWMNDGGFWLFCRLGGIKETDALKTWTVGLVFLGLSGLGVVLILSRLLPLTALS